nr:MAG TPA: hypothetical protein [Caudoviricetes sp.]
MFPSTYNKKIVTPCYNGIYVLFSYHKLYL